MTWTLVTGASSGIGREFCEQLAIRGYNVVLVARRKPRLQALADRLRNVYGVHSEIIVADLAEEDDIARVVGRLRSSERPISLLVNAAGFALKQNFVSGELERELRALDLMVKAVMILCHAAADRMARQGRGAIVNISSIVNSTSIGTYASHKTWVNTFSQVLAQELRGRGVRVISVRPGTTRTEFFGQTPDGRDAMPRLCRLEPEAVVNQALNDLARGRTSSVAGLFYRFLDRVIRHFPERWVSYLSAVIYRNRLKF